jgi:hypothetical protein
MHLHAFPYATQQAGRQSAVGLRCWRQLLKSVDEIEARARMQIDVRWSPRGTYILIGWRHEGGVPLLSAWCRLRQAVSDSYRPEVNYMRGRGPKSRE